MNISLREPKLKTIDVFFNKLGYTFIQKYLLFVIVLEYLADGAEITLLTLCLSCLTKEWQLTFTQRSLLGSSVFVGLMIGAFLSILSDKYGRKKILILGAFIIFFFGILTSFSSSYLSFLFFRILVGIGIGIIFPVSFSLASEMSPINNRSNYLNNIAFSYPLGEIIVCLLCYWYLYDCNNWRKVVLFAAIPAFISFILLFKIQESPRFLLNNNQNEEAFNILNEIGKEKGIELTSFEKIMIVKEIEKDKSLGTIEVSYLYLLSDEYFEISIRLWILWICSSFIFYGFIYIFPQILAAKNPIEETKNLYLDLLIANTFMIPVTIVGGLISENKYLGRRYSMAGCYIVCAVMTLFCIVSSSSMYIWGGLLKFCACCEFSILTTYTSEVYHTKIRTIGSSAANIITRIGGIISPFILEFMFKYFGSIGPLFMILLVILFSIYLCTTLKYETNGRALDQIYTTNKF